MPEELLDKADWTVLVIIVCSFFRAPPASISLPRLERLIVQRCDGDAFGNILQLATTTASSKLHTLEFNDLSHSAIDVTLENLISLGSRVSPQTVCFGHEGHDRGLSLDEGHVKQLLLEIAPQTGLLHLFLHKVNMQSLKGIAKRIKSTEGQPNKLIGLNIGYSPAIALGDAAERQAILDILDTWDSLIAFTWNENIKVSSPTTDLEKEVLYRCQINHAGKQLVEGATSLPLSIWPTVLERSHRVCRMCTLCPSTGKCLSKEHAHAAGLLYYFLRHGPALLCPSEVGKPTLVDDGATVKKE